MEEAVTTTTKEKPKKQTKLILAIVGIVVLIGGLITGLILSRQKQVVKKEAATSTGVAKIFITPETKVIDVDQTFSANIILDTAGQKISAITVDLGYTYSGTTPPLTATDIQISSNFIVDNRWSFPIKTINAGDGRVQIKIGGLNSSSEGYSTQGEETVATITFKGQTAGSVNATFNSTTTKVTSKTTGEDILLVPNSSGSYTVRGTTETPTPTATATASATPLSVVRSTATPTPVPVPQSGISFPSLISLSLAGVLIIGAVLLAF